MNIPVNPDPVGEAEAKHAGKPAQIIAMYMLIAAIPGAILLIMGDVAPHLQAHNRNMRIQEISQVAMYPLSLGSPTLTPDAAGNLYVEFTRPSVGPEGWSISSARLRVIKNAGGSKYTTVGQWVDLTLPLQDPISTTVPAGSLPEGALQSGSPYYVTFEAVISDGTFDKRFAIHSKYTWEAP